MRETESTFELILIFKLLFVVLLNEKCLHLLHSHFSFHFIFPPFAISMILILPWKWKIPNPFFIHLFAVFTVPGDVVTIRCDLVFFSFALLLSFQPNGLFTVCKARFFPFYIHNFFCTVSSWARHQMTTKEFHRFIFYFSR